MTAVSRTAQFTKLHKILKKHYKSAPCGSSRTVMEQLLFACCLEDAHHEPAEEAFAALVHTFFDWNEVRVTSLAELSEVMASLPDPRAAANRIKRVLHSVFEATFKFDLEDRRKGNLGPTIKWLEGLDGTTPFTVAYVVQTALGGHAIPIDSGTMAMLQVLDLVGEKDAAAGVVPGLERAVPKTKGPEFAWLLHELGAHYTANPYAASVREVLLQVNPECGSRFPKRRTERVEPKPREASEKPGKPRGAAKEAKEAPPTLAGKKSGGKSPGHKKEAAVDGHPTASSQEPSTKKPTARNSSSKSSAAKKSLPRSPSPKKQPTSEKLAKRKPK